MTETILILGGYMLIWVVWVEFVGRKFKENVGLIIREPSNTARTHSVGTNQRLS